MARRCALTGKETQFGHNVSHSKRATNRRFVPNIQKVEDVANDLHTVAKQVAADVSIACTRDVPEIQNVEEIANDVQLQQIQCIHQ